MHRFAVIGNPIAHSLSPNIHEQFAKQFDLKISYIKICAPLDAFEITVNNLKEQGLNGANITTPFKQNAFQYADTCTERAQQSGAVNTLIFQNNQCVGDNTDGAGLIRDLKNKKISIKNQRILILGAGGAARGIMFELEKHLPKSMTVLNRTQKKVQEFAIKHACENHNENKTYDLLINTTNANFATATCFDHIIDLSNTHCYDLNYGNRHQSFKRWTEKRSRKSCHDGLGMLIEQAAESFYSWTKLNPSTESIKIDNT